MRKQFKILLLAVTILFLTACSSPAMDIEKGIEISFDGLNGYGFASAVLDYNWLSQNEFEANYDYLTYEQQEIIDGMVNSIDIYIPDNQSLANGDVVNVEVKVAPEAKKYIKEATINETVKGLKEGNILTEEQMYSAFHIRFYGRDGKGYINLDYDRNFPWDYRETLKVFGIENNGKLKNGEIARVNFTKESLKKLADNGYGMVVPYVEREVTGLQRVAENYSDIVNKEDVKRFVEESVTKMINNYMEHENVTKSKRDIAYMYRPYDPSESRSDFGRYSELHDASLIKIYYYKQDSPHEFHREEHYSIYELFNLFLDDQNAANFTTASTKKRSMDLSYSDATVIQYYQGLGYQLIEEGANE